MGPTERPKLKSCLTTEISLIFNKNLNIEFNEIWHSRDSIFANNWDSAIKTALVTTTNVISKTLTVNQNMSFNITFDSFSIILQTDTLLPFLMNDLITNNDNFRIVNLQNNFVKGLRNPNIENSQWSVYNMSILNVALNTTCLSVSPSYIFILSHYFLVSVFLFYLLM